MAISVAVPPCVKEPTAKQVVKWKVVHAAKRRGLFIRAIARETGIHRNILRRYLEADSPPMNCHRRPRVKLKASQSVTVAT